MCGIAGFVDLKGQYDSASLWNQVVAMSDTLIHRGPDSSGYWVDDQNGIALGHRRLSIVDTSPGGAQPMSSNDGSITVCFNGEIYNHHELRSELSKAGITFNSSSDTEVLVEAITQWGLEHAVSKLIGQFAFALVDRASKKFHLVRDRVGEKPLYYGWLDSELVFASELKALTVLPDWKGEINREALCLYFRHNYIPSPHSIYKDIYKLPPASIFTMGLDQTTTRPDFNIAKYWSLFSVRQQQPSNGVQIENAISESVRRQMVADVPVGAFLSGGVDSSTIVAMMTEHSKLPIQTFTIGFDEAKFNEAEHASKVATHLGTDHHEFILSSNDALDIIPSLPDIYDEPFSDSSQLPTYLVSKMTRSKVTVALSGDGGDELFCGYERYFLAKEVWAKLSRIPRALLGLLTSFIVNAPIPVLKTFCSIAQRLPGSGSKLSPTKLQRLAVLAGYTKFDHLYRGLVSHDLQPHKLVLDSTEGVSEFSNEPKYGSSSQWGDMMARDINTYLPDDILAKVDRASMANSLEVRVPLLSHDVMAHAWSRAPAFDDQIPQPSKKILRDILYKRVPKNLIERPKAGFAVPMNEWLNGPLKPWVLDLLSPGLVKKQGLLDHRLVSTMLTDHYNGRVDHRDRIWNLAVFQAWLTNVQI